MYCMEFTGTERHKEGGDKVQAEYSSSFESPALTPFSDPTSTKSNCPGHK